LRTNRCAHATEVESVVQLRNSLGLSALTSVTCRGTCGPTSHTLIVQYPFRGKLGRQEHHWQTRAGVGAAPYEVEVAVAGMAVVRAHVAHL